MKTLHLHELTKGCQQLLRKNILATGCLLAFVLETEQSSAQLLPCNAAAAPQQINAAHTLKQSTNSIWFERNQGQFQDKNIRYGFRTPFGSMGVFDNKLRIVSKQDAQKKKGYQVVDISFTGAQKSWQIEPGNRSEVKGAYNISNKTISPDIYNEIILKNVYEGIDLRLYSGDNGTLEFDWLVGRAADYNKIKMLFTGQNYLKTDKKGNLIIGLACNNIKISIPETYQLIEGNKKILHAAMFTMPDKKTVAYAVYGNFDKEVPLVIDPVMSWSTYMHNNSSTFDEYLYAVAANSADEIYACGLTNEAMSIAYLSNITPGYSASYTSAANSNGSQQTSILYKLNSQGTAVTAWTYTGLTSNVPVALGIFPNNNVLVLYQKDTIQVFSPDLSSRLYSDVISPAVANNVFSYQSLAIVDDNIFYLGGVADNALPDSIIPPTAPDITLAGNEAVILRINISGSVPVAEWGTYVGGSARETFTAIALTPDKTKLAFAVHTEGSGNSYPALVNAVDSNIGGNELLVGNFVLPAPTSFNVFSYLGGSGNEGASSSSSSAALVTADNDYFYVAGNTSSTSFPGANGTAQTNHGLNSRFSDQFLSRIPINGSIDTGFATTYNGGNDVDLVGGLVRDSRTGRVLLFGTTMSSDFPVYSPNPYSPYYQSEHGSFTNGSRDITYTIFSNDLRQRVYSTYIGGAYDDYLGSTGKLEGTGHFQYSNSTGLTYIGTTIHSDETSLPEQWMSGIPGFDKSIPPATRSKDNHYIFAINPNTSDYGDAPSNYDGSDPANSAVALDLRLGYITDAEDKPNSSALANGDDIQNYGYGDDEDAIVSAPSLAAGATAYTVGVSVYNKTGRDMKLCGWIDTDGNGVFDAYEYTEEWVPSGSGQQNIVLKFLGLPAFTPVGGKTYLRIRISSIELFSSNATGTFGKGEVEDYIVPQAVILPIMLQQFTATLQNETALLQWQVTNEMNVQMYQAEHSIDNRTFITIGEKAASNSNSYNLVHFTPADGNNYYRIKTVSTGGTVSYSPSRKIYLARNRSVMVSPNPAHDFVQVSMKTLANKPVSISLLAADGKLLTKKTLAAAHETETIDVGRLARGYYFVKIETPEETIVKTIGVAH